MREPPAESPTTVYAWYVLAVLTLANISANVDQYILSLLVEPIKRDLGISDVQMSLLSGFAFTAFYALLGFPIARLADRVSRRNLIGGGVALWSVFTTACAAAASYPRLLLLRVGVGVGEATLGAPSVSLLSDYFPSDRRGRALSTYSLGIYLGAGAAYFIGGLIVGLVKDQGMWTVPVIGAIHPWQSVFLAVGLPGLVIAALMFTVREPARRERDHQLPLSALVAYVRANRRTYVAHSFGFAASGLVNSALAFWLATFFVRTYGFTPSQAGKVQGILTMTIGTIGVLSGGWAADRYLRRGKSGGPLRVGMIGSAGMLVSATAMPLMPNATLAIACLAVVNFFAAFPWGAAAAAASEMAPRELRAQGVSLFFFVRAFVSQGLGPFLVGLLTDHVFGVNEIRYSLVVVNVVAMLTALALFAAGLGSYQRTLEYRERWTPAS